ncbi:hypothetical protein SteCoe_11675 [Stentor coeruleus]|uniref:START domain-containing protein n=1 Tax=Stentor coeruleus TaxID=5963 RepID=A0A1R2CCK7_9CILI|nr:hypothetical protein SteCoe_11675 [Stentor coeruleus]
MQDVDYLIEEFKSAFYSCRYNDLCSIYTQLREAGKNDSKLKRLLDFAEYRRFKSEEEFLEVCLNYLDSSEWSVVSDSNGIKVESRGGGNEFYTRCTVNINSSLFKVISVLSEPDLVTTWVDVLKQVDVYHSPTMTRKLVKYLFWFPWPVSDRHCVMEFNALPLVQRRALIVTMKSPTSENYLNFKIPALRDGETRMWVRVGCLYAEYVDENRTKVVFMINSDMNIAILPLVLINFGAKHIMYYVMDKLRNKIENFDGSVYEERVRAKPEYYDFLQKTISESI